MRQSWRDGILDTQAQCAWLRRSYGPSLIAIFEQQLIEIGVGTGYPRSLNHSRKLDLVSETARYDRAAKILFDLLDFLSAKMGKRHALRS
jgi:hypothetical protein